MLRHPYMHHSNTQPGRSSQQVRELGLPKILDVIYVGCPASGKAEGVLELRMALYDISFSLTLPRCKYSFITWQGCFIPLSLSWLSSVLPTCSFRFSFLSLLPFLLPSLLSSSLLLSPPLSSSLLLSPLLLPFLSDSWCCQPDQATGTANSCVFPEARGESKGAGRGASS